MAHPAAADEAARPEDAVEVARILGAWGVKGGIKLKPLSSDPQALFSSKHWFIEPPATALPRPLGAPAVVLPRVLRVLQVRDQGDGVVATTEELHERDAAQALAGARVFVSRASFPAPDDQEFYWIDLIGLAVLNRQQRALGTVVGLIETGPHCVLRLQPQDAAAEEVLIPFVAAYVDSVDIPGKLIVVDWDFGD